MTIRRIIWILASILLIVVVVFSYSTVKKQLAMKQLRDIHTQEKAENTEGSDQPDIEENDENADSNEAIETAEDPIKDYLTEKVHHTINRLFNKDIKIVAIGDSLTQGVGDEADNGGYVGILKDTINKDRKLIDIDNFGKRGIRTDQLIVRMEEPEIKEALDEADIILITIGANDIMQIFKENFTDLKLDQFTSEKMNYENRLHYIFSELETSNSKVDIYLVGFYNPFEKYFADIDELETIIHTWNKLGEDITKEYDQVQYIPTKDLYEDTSINYFSDDNFHPNHLGYELMAKRILEYIVNEGDQDEQDR